MLSCMVFCTRHIYSASQQLKEWLGSVLQSLELCCMRWKSNCTENCQGHEESDWTCSATLYNEMQILHSEFEWYMEEKAALLKQLLQKKKQFELRTEKNLLDTNGISLEIKTNWAEMTTRINDLVNVWFLLCGRRSCQAAISGNKPYVHFYPWYNSLS